MHWSGKNSVFVRVMALPMVTFFGVATAVADSTELRGDEVPHAQRALAGSATQGVVGLPCGPGNGDCGVANQTPGCDDAVCCAAVCAVDAFCCGGTWDSMCVGVAAGQPDCTPIFGTCCFIDGGCTDTTATGCVTFGGTFQGTGTRCATTFCPIICGLGAGDCLTANGTPGCDNTLCCTNICAVDPFCCNNNWDGQCAAQAMIDPSCQGGACCLPGSLCFDAFDPFDCQNSGGLFQGVGTMCLTTICPEPPTTCCLPDGSCVLVVDEQACLDQGGDVIGVGVPCGPGLCPAGACCFPDGSCIVVANQSGCETAGGTYQGDFTFCMPNDCPQPSGACCFSDGTCQLVPEVVCDALAGLYQGDGTVCVPDPCAAPCPWDCIPAPDGNGVVNIDDLLAVINAFGEPGGTCDNAPDNGDGTFGNGTVNIDDLLGVINNFGECP